MSYLRVLSRTSLRTASRFSRSLPACNSARSIRFYSNPATPPKPTNDADEIKKPDTQAPKASAKEGTSIISDEMMEDLAQDEVKSSENSKKSRRQTSSEIRRDKYARTSMIIILGGLSAYGAYMCRELTEDEVAKVSEEEKHIATGYSLENVFARFKKRYYGFVTLFTEPIAEKLLPDKSPQLPPLTLVISFEDLLIHSEWTQKYGWRVALRPGALDFILYLSSLYEVVLFANSNSIYLQGILEKIDPHGLYFPVKLFKEECRVVNGKQVKDLSLLNRDLSKVIILDTKPENFALQPENGVLIKPWDGKPDKDLIKYVPFLEYLALQSQQVKDVRPIIATFNDKTRVPEIFAEREQKFKEQYLKDHARSGLVDSTINFICKILQLPVELDQTQTPLDSARQKMMAQFEFNKKRVAQLIKETEKNSKLNDGEKVNIADLIFAGGDPSAAAGATGAATEAAKVSVPK